jgi:hypothetical protein
MLPAEEIQDCLYSNYEDLREELVRKYKIYKDIKTTYEPIFEPEINKQFLDMVQSFVSTYIHNKTLANLEEVKVYVEDHFTFDNIERIISEDGAI